MDMAASLTRKTCVALDVIVRTVKFPTESHLCVHVNPWSCSWTGLLN